MNPIMRTTEGSLDGKTIVRFSHSYTEGAGIENHLEYLNRELLKRNSMNIIQIYMHSDKSLSTESVSFGKGTLLKIPLSSIPGTNSRTRANYINSLLKKLLSFTRYSSASNVTDALKFMLYTTQIRILGESSRKLYEKRFRAFEHMDVVIQKIFTRSSVDLVVNHFAGSKDSLLLLQAAQQYSIPVLVINHFHNRWLNYIPIREQLHFATMAAGVSGQNIPRYIRNRFVNLSNGIDTSFFRKSLVTPPDNYKSSNPVVLLPARVHSSKGHIDLLKAAHILRKNGKLINLVFVGRVDSDDYKELLIKYAYEHNLQNQVEFRGLVNQISLRQWYSISDIVALPSYQEGFGRVLLEAQAMEIVPIAYKNGGTPEALVDNETGFLIEPGAIAKLVSKIELLINNPQLRIQMGAAGRKFVEKNFSLPALAQRHELTYYNIMSRTNASF
jgi:glycosyltransferase involved in cell wall biosynthesis